jgi:hypothetical protein
MGFSKQWKHYRIFRYHGKTWLAQAILLAIFLPLVDVSEYKWHAYDLEMCTSKKRFYAFGANSLIRIRQEEKSANKISSVNKTQDQRGPFWPKF